MKIPQFFEKVGKNQYALVSTPSNTTPLYVWDDKKKCIVPVDPLKRTSDQQIPAKT